jgi:SAM-dependent methyltransferase
MASIISAITKNIPRHQLQRFSHIILQCVAPFYFGSTYTDPISGKSYRKLLPYGRGEHHRENALAPNSLSLERHRLMWLYLQKESNFFSGEPKEVLHIAPEYCFLKKFKAIKGMKYFTADLNSPWADYHFDVHQIPFNDNKFDVIFCNHVLEHVENHQQVLKEFYRVMKPGGFGIFQVPIDNSRNITYEDKSITSPAEREKHFWQADHVRLFGANYPEVLAEAGFKVKIYDYTKELPKSEYEKYALMPNELLYICFK